MEIKRNKGFHWIPFCYTQKFEDGKYKKTNWLWLNWMFIFDTKSTMKEFKQNDLILPMLKLPNPCPVRITLDEKYLRLFVGQRDWQWNLEDGHLVGCGTGCCGYIPNGTANKTIAATTTNGPCDVTYTIVPTEKI